MGDPTAHSAFRLQEPVERFKGPAVQRCASGSERVLRELSPGPARPAPAELG